jgi:hypothetical protein
MARRRMTVPVEFVRTRVNNLLARPRMGSTPWDRLTPDQAFRLGAASVLEAILHETGNYKGFHYLHVDHSTPTPTIADETRRGYNS